MAKVDLKNLIELGTHKQGESILMDWQVLLRTQLLIQANSGGGKSHTMRRLAEQLFGRVPIIIIDPEGEFATLRERFNFVLVGPGGEVAADVPSAGLLAHKLLEMGESAVCDLSEMPPAERPRWVAAFATALIESPKSLWHDVVIMIDEAHRYCPEKGHGESVASEPVINLASLGRKRGFCSVLATQRLGKLSKDAAAELQNVLIGKTWLDIDRKRAADNLGIGKGEELRTFFGQVKLLKPGQFFGLGRAVALETTLFDVGKVSTTHPDPGARRSAPPSLTESVRRRMLDQLANLPKEAAKKSLTEADLRARIIDLEKQLLTAKRAVVATVPSQPPVPPPPVQVPVVPPEIVAKVRDALTQISLIESNAKDATRELSAALKQAESLPKQRPVQAPVPSRVQPSPPPTTPRSTHRTQSEPTTKLNGQLVGKSFRMLEVLSSYGTLSRSELAVRSCISQSGTFTNYVSDLYSAGFIEKQHGSVSITEQGVAFLGRTLLGRTPRHPEHEALVQEWSAKFTGKARDMFLHLVELGGGAISRSDLAAAVGIAESGTFTNYISDLYSAGVLEKEHGSVSASKALWT